MDPAHDTDSPFVGRERELETLASGLRDAASGRPRYFLVTGDAGIGKTRTTEELVRRAQLPEARVLWGRAPEQAGAPSYWPWIRALEHYITRADARTLPEALAGDGPVLAYLVPAIRQRCPDIEPVAAAGRRRRGTVHAPRRRDRLPPPRGGNRPPAARARGPALGRRGVTRAARLRLRGAARDAAAAGGDLPRARASSADARLRGCGAARAAHCAARTRSRRCRRPDCAGDAST